MKLERDFYTRDTLTIARQLIGKVLIHRTDEGITSGRIVEVEAYIGPEDKASHSHKGIRTGRTNIQYGPGGYAYIYLIYGMYYCMNIVTNVEEKPEAVLIRALEPIDGIELMKKRRKTNNPINLCNGPGKLCTAMAIDKQCYGADLCGSTLYLEDEGAAIDQEMIIATKRINIDYAKEAVDYPWRFVLSGSRCLSAKP